MSSFLDSVSVVISFFVDWLSNLTISLISNPVIQLVFSISLIFALLRFVINIIFNKNDSSYTINTFDGSKTTSTTYYYNSNVEKERSNDVDYLIDHMF